MGSCQAKNLAALFLYIEKTALENVNRTPSRGQIKNIKFSRPAAIGLLAAFYVARQSVCFSIGVRTPRLRWTRLVL